MDLGLSNRAAIVTGASVGIGRAIAEGLCREGARVLISARGADRLDAARAELAALGGRVEAVAADVGTRAGAESVVGEALKQFGQLDILVNNAGGSTGGPAGFLALADENWQRAWEQNLMSAVWCSRAAIPHMQSRRWGRIINISSTSGHQPDVVVPHYNVAKAGLINLSKTLANAFGADGILVNCVCPGLTRTPAVEATAKRRLEEAGEAIEGKSAQELVDRYWGARRTFPAGRVGVPADIAGLVTFLCSEQAAWITGGCFNVDGGWTKAMV